MNTARFLKCVRPFFSTIPAGIYLLKVNNRNTKTRFEICSELTIKTLERRQWRRFAIFIINSKYISHRVSIADFEHVTPAGMHERVKQIMTSYPSH